MHKIKQLNYGILEIQRKCLYFKTISDYNNTNLLSHFCYKNSHVIKLEIYNNKKKSEGTILKTVLKIFSSKLRLFVFADDYT